MVSKSENSVPLLKIERATVTKGGVPILHNLSLEIPEGQHTAILGPNGSGKSSLIKLITRHHYAAMRADDPPMVSLFGHENWDLFELRSLLGIVSPELHAAFTGAGGITGLEAVVSGFFASQGLARHHNVTSKMRARAEEALAGMGALGLAGKPLEQMSAGEARRVLIARAMVHDPRALLLDEPTTGLDLVVRRQFLEALRQIARRGKTVLLVTHHVDEVIPEIERVVMMKHGRIFRDGPKAEMMREEHLSALFDAPVAIHERDGYYAAELV